MWRPNSDEHKNHFGGFIQPHGNLTSRSFNKGSGRAFFDSSKRNQSFQPKGPVAVAVADSLGQMEQSTSNQIRDLPSPREQQPTSLSALAPAAAPALDSSLSNKSLNSSSAPVPDIPLVLGEVASKLADRVLLDDKNSTLPNLPLAPTLPPLHLEALPPFASTFSYQELSDPACGLVTGLFANGHATRWEYYMQALTEVDENPSGVLLHVMEPLSLKPGVIPKVQHPILFSLFSYVKMKVEVNFFPLPWPITDPRTPSQSAARQSGTHAGSASFELQLFPEYVGSDHFFQCVGTGSTVLKSSSSENKAFTFEEGEIRLTAELLKNTHDVLNIKDENKFFVLFRVGHSHEGIENGTRRFFWNAVVTTLIHHF